MNKFVIFCSLFLLILTNNNLAFAQKSINVLTIGAKNDGHFDNWSILQKAVDRLANSGGGELYFPNGNYAIYNKSLLIWGNNITIRGESKHDVKIIKKGKVGSFGDCIDVAGKIPGYVYYGDFGKGDYSVPKYYKGSAVPANGIIIENVTITSQLNSQAKYHLANNLGIVNSKNVTVRNCILSNAPQSNLAIVNDQKLFVNENVNITNCVFEGSRRHNVRVITMNQGPFKGNKVSISNSIFRNVSGADDRVKELVGKQVNLWYRGGASSNGYKLVVTNCKFDDSGIVYANGNVNGFELSNSEIFDNVFIYHTISQSSNPSINLIGNTVHPSKNVNKHINNSLKRRFNKVDNVNIYPRSILNSKGLNLK